MASKSRGTSSQKKTPAKQKKSNKDAPPTDDSTIMCSEDESREGFNLNTIADDLQLIKDELKNVLKKGDIEQLITNTVNKVLQTFEEKIRSDISKQIKEIVSPLKDEIEFLKHENKEIKDEMKKTSDAFQKRSLEAAEQINEHSRKINDAIKLGNHNEQYSRKNNIKVMNVEMGKSETEGELTNKVCSILNSVGAADPTGIVAIHRLPSRDPRNKPVIIKTINNSVKSKIMRKRKDLRSARHRIVDDVTRLNTGLISRLLNHNDIKSAWFFNGSVFAETDRSERVKFDFFDNITQVIRDYREKRKTA